MFWKVAGFSQPSPIEQLLDSEDSLTLEQLLDEDDLIQECKSLNGRLIAFLRQRGTVEKLLRYLVEPSQDFEDPKRQYKYPFTACEVFCCEVEAVFNTLLEDAELMALLFSLLDSDAALNCKTAGYFGRVIGHLLIRKTNEMMSYLQSNQGMLEKLIKHVDTTSVADIIKRLVGADEQSSMLFVPSHTQWLSETPLVDMLLQRLASGHSPDVQGNTADILCAIAHMQPSALSSKLMQEESIDILFQHALMPGSQVLVPAMEVCIALLEPRRSPNDPSPEGTSPTAAAAQRFKLQAVHSIVKYVPRLVELLKHEDSSSTQETPYGLLAPPLGSSRLKITELLATLVRTAEEAAEQALMQSNAFTLCMDVFARYPFNNLLHHNVASMLLAALAHMSDSILQHIFQQCKLLDWLISLPTNVTPTPRPGMEAAAEGRAPLRAGYMGHVTTLANRLIELHDSQEAIRGQMGGHEGWMKWVQQVLAPRNELEDVQRWQCGRPSAADMGAMDSDGDDYQGMPPALYHRYPDDNEEDDEEEERGDEFAAKFADSMAVETSVVAEGIAGMEIADTDAIEMDERQALALAAGVGNPGTTSHALDLTKSMDNDEVLLESSDDDDAAAMEQDTAVVPQPEPAAATAAAAVEEQPEPAEAAEPAAAQEQAAVSEAAGAAGGGSSSEPAAAEMDTSPPAEPAQASAAVVEAAAGNGDAAASSSEEEAGAAAAAASEQPSQQQQQEQQGGDVQQEDVNSAEFSDVVYWKKASLSYQVPEDA